MPRARAFVGRVLPPAPSRFTDPKQVARYAGLDPRSCNPAKNSGYGRISKNGKTLLRTLLVEVALGPARRDEGALGQFYRRERAQIGQHKTAVALARKILVVAWRMLLTGEVYRTSKPGQATRKHRLLDHLAGHTSSPVAILNGSVSQAHLAYAGLHHLRVPRTAVSA